MKTIIARRSIRSKIFGIVLLSTFLITAMLGYLSFEFSKARLLYMLGGSIKGIAITIASLMQQEDITVLSKNSERIRTEYMSAGIRSFSNVYERKLKRPLEEKTEGQDESIRLYTKYAKLLSEIKKANRVDSPINIYVLDKNRLKLIMTSESALLTGSNYSMRSEAKVAFWGGTPTSTGIYNDKDGMWISAYAATPLSLSGNERILVEVNYKVSSYISRLRRELLMIIIICAAGFVGTLLISSRLVNTLVAAVKKLDNAAKDLERERYDKPVDVKTDDEIGHLSETFEKLRISMREKIEELRLSLIREKKAHFESVVALTNAIEMRDPYTKGHLMRVEKYALLIAKAMNLPPNQIESLKYSCFLHDIGKISIDNSILQKEKLLPKEYEEIKTHSEKGAKIIEGIKFLNDVKAAILYHQERYDGKGYPEGLKGDQIPLLARIVSVADTFDAMTTDRPYKKKIGFREAMDEIEKASGTQLDPEVCGAFLKYRDNIEDIAKKHHFESQDTPPSKNPPHEIA